MSNELVPAGVDRDAILRHLRLDPTDVNTQALLLICQRYGLDPLMKHMVLISGKPYVTRDGYMHIAHASGKLDGLEVVEEGETTSEWWAKVAVHRRDMTHPFTYKGRYPKSGQQKQYGPEMAIKCAEVMALRRAFDVTGVGAADEQWDEHIEVMVASPETHQQIRDAIAALPKDTQQQLVAWWKDNGLPPISQADRLTESQAEGVLAHLETLTQDPSGETPSPVSPDALPPAPPPSTDEVDGAAGADTQHSEAASAPAASISPPVVERLRLRLNTLPDETRAAVQGVIAATWGSLELVPEAEARDVSRLLGDAEKAAKTASGLASRAAGHANQESAA